MTIIKNEYWLLTWTAKNTRQFAMFTSKQCCRDVLDQFLSTADVRETFGDHKTISTAAYYWHVDGSH